jgi:hypothetical protein
MCKVLAQDLYLAESSWVNTQITIRGTIVYRVIPPERLMINGIAMKGGVLDNRLAPLDSRDQ